MSFKEQYRDLQELVREYTIVRNNNLKFKKGDPQTNLLLFAEGSLILVVLERFLRILPDVQSTDKDTLLNLLEKATSKTRNILSLGNNDRDSFIKAITKVRNTIQHGNYEQAARNCNLSVEDYFKNQFTKEVETLYLITNELFKQIDPQTGKRYSV